MELRQETDQLVVCIEEIAVSNLDCIQFNATKRACPFQSLENKMCSYQGYTKGT